MKNFLNRINYKNNYFWIIIIIYTFAFGLIILNKGIFWDDWTLVYVSKVAVREEFAQAGLPLWGIIHSFILHSPFGISIYRFATFVFYLFAGFFLDTILKTVKQIDFRSRFFLVAFFVLFPVNFARIALIDLPYGLCYFLFFFAFALLAKFLKVRKTYLRIIALVLFFLSFFTNSFLLFYLLPFVYIFYIERKNIRDAAGFARKLFAYLDFLIMPLLFWVIKSIFFRPYGLYDNYNKITAQSFKMLFFKLISAFDSSFTAILKNSFKFLTGNLYLVVLTIAGVFIIYFLLNKFLSFSKTCANVTIDVYFFVFGLVTFGLGILPYLSVGALPTVDEWTNRHQLLVPLGAAFLLFYGLKIIFFLIQKVLPFRGISIPSIERYFFTLIILLFVAYNFTAYLSFQKDWFKQLSLVENFKSYDILKNNTTFLFVDNTSNLNAIKRTYRFYEYNGLLKLVFGKENRFAAPAESFNHIDDYKNYIPYPVYNMVDYQAENPQYKISIDQGSFCLCGTNIVRLYSWQWINMPDYKVSVKNIIKLSDHKLE